MVWVVVVAPQGQAGNCAIYSPSPRRPGPPSAFLEQAFSIFEARYSPFELIDVEETAIGSLQESQRYRLARSVNAEHLVDELLTAVLSWRSDRQPAEVPETGDIHLRAVVGEEFRVFVVPATFRAHLFPPGESLPVPLVTAAAEIQWRREDLLHIATELDALEELHSSHVRSIEQIIGTAAQLGAESGLFYRVRVSPTRCLDQNKAAAGISVDLGGGARRTGRNRLGRASKALKSMEEEGADEIQRLGSAALRQKPYSRCHKTSVRLGQRRLLGATGHRNVNLESAPRCTNLKRCYR